MSITAKGAKSIRKTDLPSQKNLALGFKNLAFYHKATIGQTGINIYSLVMPPELSSIGFTQASSSDLSSANLMFYKNNLTIVSNTRGIFQIGTAYDVSSNSQITFLNGIVALSGEIFTCQINPVSKTGLNAVDASPINATGPLTAGTVDFNVGTPFAVNKYPSAQVGAVLVYLDGVLQSRNTGNSSVTLDGNYYEVDAGSGLGNIIRFNQVDLTNDRDVKVLSNGMNSERPDGSMMAVIEGINGKLNNLAPYVATLAVLPLSTVLGAAPSNVDLKSFGDSVSSQGARITTLETSYPASKVTGRTDGAAPSASFIGQVVTATLAGIGQASPVANQYYDDAGTLSLLAGSWLICSGYSIVGESPTVGTALQVPFLVAALRTGASTEVAKMFTTNATTSVYTFFGSSTIVVPVNIASTTIYRQSVKWQQNTGSPTLGVISTSAAACYLFAVRVA